jgi:hypothetical protein
MTLIDSTYFEYWNLIPNTNEPDPNNRSSEDLDLIIESVEKEVLSYAFGFKMWNDFKTYILVNGFDTNAPQNYKDIVFGKEYTKNVGSETKDCLWAGLLEENPKSSLLADIIYYTYKTNNATQTTQFGESKVDTKVGNKASITPKVTKAYNSFVTKFNGGIKSFPNGYTMEGNPYWFVNGGVDYYGVYDNWGEVSLMRFLLDNKEDYPLLNTDISRFGLSIKNEFGL